MSTDLQALVREARGLCREHRLDDARILLERVVSGDPRATDARLLLARVQIDLQLWSSALDSASTALAAGGHAAAAWYTIGRAQAGLGHGDAARNCYRRALLMEPRNSAILTSLGTALYEIGRREAAVQAYRQALAAHPDDRGARASLDFIEGPSAAGADRLTQLKQEAEDLQAAGRLKEALQLHHEALRIAPHVAGIWLSAGVLADAIGERAGSLPLFEEAARLQPSLFPAVEGARRMCASAGLLDKAERYSDLAYAQWPSDDVLIAKLMCSSAPLFYQDIGMEPTSYLLAHSRLAPVQCVSFGHPNTTGIPNIDYFVSNDLYEPADAASHYSEELYLLPDLPTLAYYYRPDPPPPLKSRHDFGLLDTDHVYLCPQTLFKVHPEFDEIIGGILRRDPRSVVVFIRGQYDDYTDQLLRRFARTLPDFGGRILMLDQMPFRRFMQLLAAADVCLDTPHFNGMNSSLEALSVGTPIVTLPGRLQRGRHTQAMYRKMGILECIASDAMHYIDIAVRLGCDREFAEGMRHRILAQNAVLYEDERVVREFERFFFAALKDKRPSIPWESLNPNR